MVQPNKTKKNSAQNRFCNLKYVESLKAKALNIFVNTELKSSNNHVEAATLVIQARFCFVFENYHLSIQENKRTKMSRGITDMMMQSSYKFQSLHTKGLEKIQWAHFLLVIHLQFLINEEDESKFYGINPCPMFLAPPWPWSRAMRSGTELVDGMGWHVSHPISKTNFILH